MTIWQHRSFIVDWLSVLHWWFGDTFDSWRHSLSYAKRFYICIMLDNSLCHLNRLRSLYLCLIWHIWSQTDHRSATSADLWYMVAFERQNRCWQVSRLKISQPKFSFRVSAPNPNKALFIKRNANFPNRYLNNSWHSSLNFYNCIFF